MKTRPLFSLCLAFCSASALAAPAMDAATRQPLNLAAIGMFLVFVVFTLCITWWAARRMRSTADFYSAGGGITGLQNGLALAGDYMSASTLLGITALIYTSGMDGYIYLIAFFAGWPVLLLLMTERMRNLGRFTFADITSYRLDQGKVRTMAAIGSLTVVCFYLVAQMVGAGQLIKLLFGLDYHIALLIVGALMMLYVTFGGMVATTWVQIIKAFLLMVGGTLVLLLAMNEFDFSYDTLVSRAMSVHGLGDHLLAPGSLLADPLTALSLSLGLVFGTAGLPHILMRFFTVSDAKEARKSVLYATGFIGYFFNVIFLLGLASIVIVSQDPQYFEGGQVGGKLLGGGNMVAMHLAQAVGGDMMLGFLSAVTFATILAVVSGLALAGASAIAHDLYARVIKKGTASEAQELRVTKFATLGLGLVAIGLGIVFENTNVAFMVALAFGIAASANFPVLFLSMFWRGLTTRGALVGGYTGLVSAMAFVVLSKLVWVDVFHFSEALFPYTQPALFSMPLAFLAAYVFSKLDHSTRANTERKAFEDQYVRGQTGVGASGATAH
ncbi:Cation/acetate symporter ActP [Stutzerimonas frequens]|jgi:cation/acetate symporter|uniref:Cation/acetate symporter ActP n=1 Tax=Stutzerimonas stutzeri TaxID=316 RepID=A0AA42H4K5_STUST|nr:MULTISPECIES: cation acetate symporter [Pseudomonadaceae]MAL91240.1 cation acetate symporter [Pseudomonas sp.]MEC7474582.1 cation acetate symporter [Pseudomonadota bacterium]MBH3356335.1 cation acetate symporter [Stutzerimonas stutzeri]MBH3385872.1 cation acetate symporter [Pseudomonas juntendi]MCH2341968.1 cation acetate symporter [Pseudomonas sp.]|tara:strand:- start:257 stop:1921 length:1665 start_codon:yes stop_codon:yes gene_type:complete